MNSIAKLLFLTTFCLPVLFMSSEGLAQVEIKPVNQWGDKTRDQTHFKAAPENGMITDRATWNTLWEKWQTGKPLPEVDFSTDMVVVHQVRGPNQVILSKVMLTDGDLTIQAGATRMAGTGFGFVLLQVKREGINSFKGKAIPGSGSGANTTTTNSENRVIVDATGILDVESTGRRITKSTLTVDNIVWDLKLQGQMARWAATNSGLRVQIKGQLSKRRVGNFDNWTVDVRSIERAAEQGGSAGVGSTEVAFIEIVLERTGGIAGFMERHTTKPDGKVEVHSLNGGQKLSERQMSAAQLAQLNRLVADTNWADVPKEAANESAIADGMHYNIRLTTNEGVLNFDYDSIPARNSEEINALIKVLMSR